MRQVELSQVTTEGKPARYHVNGRRVSQAAYARIIGRALRIDCFSTRAKELPGDRGRFKRWNYSTATLAE
jgi:hypothetical protein